MSLDDEVSDARKRIYRDGYDMSLGEIASLYERKELVIQPEYNGYFVGMKPEELGLLSLFCLIYLFHQSLFSQARVVYGNLWMDCSVSQQCLNLWACCATQKVRSNLVFGAMVPICCHH